MCDGEAGGLARPPALAALPSQLLGNTPAADSRRRVMARGEMAFPEALSAAVPGLGNTWPAAWGGLGEPRPDPGRTKQPGGIRGKEGGWLKGAFPQIFHLDCAAEGVFWVRTCPPGCPWLCRGFAGVSGVAAGRENSIPLPSRRAAESECPAYNLAKGCRTAVGHRCPVYPGGTLHGKPPSIHRQKAMRKSPLLSSCRRV